MGCRSSHFDPTHSGYTFSWSIVQEPDPQASLPELAPVQTLRNKRSTEEADPQLVAPEGGNFVDVSLRVKVIQVKGSLLVHRPDFAHGTTRLCGMRTCGLAIPFTMRVKEKFEEMKRKGTYIVESGSIQHNDSVA